MKVSKDVVLDLLPLYVAGEASADTRDLVEEYLASDAELARVAARLKSMGTLGAAPPVRREAEMQGLIEAKRQVTLRVLGIAALVAFTIVVALGLAAFFLFLPPH